MVGSDNTVGLRPLNGSRLFAKRHATMLKARSAEVVILDSIGRKHFLKFFILGVKKKVGKKVERN